MNEQTYLARVLETESKPKTIECSIVSLDMILGLGIAVGEVMNRAKRAIFYGKPLESAEMLDALAQALNLSQCLGTVVHAGMFNNADFAAKLIAEGNDGKTAELFKDAKLGNVNMRLLHGALGHMSETGEKYEALREQLLTGKFDLVNYAEEMGDSSWYTGIEVDELAILAQQAAADSYAEQTKDGNAGLAIPLDVSPDALRARNIQKLQDKKAGRYKSGGFTTDGAVNRDTAAERVILEANPANNDQVA
jgi:NTP pyrophosphatase (non-canonical NTP hydrolase)